MSDVIQLLPDSVANQIAAGEVIQRPASVIKELVENSVDAGASNICVLVVDAGRTSIQVIDDGVGMSETDARLAFERHATSKIRKADDLFSLNTMGFRGEALPSIAAVAQVELSTRTSSEDIGTHLTIQASHVVGQEPIGCPVGSNFKVENLFFNVPARRKFLKTNTTELNNIISAFERIVLVYPTIHFSLYSNGQELMNLKAGNLHQRIADVFGKKTSQGLLPLDVETALCKITGFVGKPETARKKGSGDYFFVNGRFMRHSYFHKAVVSAYERLVPVGMQVPYFIYFEVSPSDIDVNIHPTKTEIKFENEQGIWQILQAAVKDAIGKYSDVPSIDFDTEGKPEIPVFDSFREVVDIPKVQYNPDYNPFASLGNKTHSSAVTMSEKLRNNVDSEWQQLYDIPSDISSNSDIFVDKHLSLQSDLLKLEKSPTHYQYKGRYIMAAVKSGLMIIDQHRADFRIRFESYLTRFGRNIGNSQRLLFPEVVEFSKSEDLLLIRFMSDLIKIGFDLSPLGGGSYAINGIPVEMEGLEPSELIREMINDAADKGEGDAESIHSAIALSLARHAAIPYGQVLNNDEMDKIVNELFMCKNVNYTPDGKLILSILPQHDIECLFN